ncbi:MAG: class I SAM-dependent methyltransferase [Thiohalocapsa sp.]
MNRGNESDGPQRKWDDRYRAASDQRPASQVLIENLHLLPARGRALDLACGLGANALLLARQGLEVSAWDLSPVAVERLRGIAAAERLGVAAVVRDVEQWPPEPRSFDVIVVAHFLDRNLAPAISAALRSGGLLYYQTFSRESVSGSGPSSPRFRLERGELLGLFADLIPRVYREEGTLGDTVQGLRDEAMIIAQRT